MVYVQLAREWTDGTGAAHGAGDMIDVDAVTLAELEATGVIAGPDAGHGGKPLTVAPAWVGPTSDPTSTSTSNKPASATSTPKPSPKPTWVGPTDVGN
jgi:hypothetical protein